MRYVLSTSTSTNVLSQLCFFLTKNSNPNIRDVLEGISTITSRYMISVRKPVTVVLRQVRAGVFAINNDQGLFTQRDNILLHQGKIIENMLTVPGPEFERKFLRTAEGRQEQDFHRFALLNEEVLIRSQIDCVRGDDPGCFFEIKSRAVTPIRYDLRNWQDYTDYELKSRLGEFESFQREYADLIRGSFLKFCFQMMIGDMEGAFVAYHNTSRFFGCQYIRLQEFINRLFENEYHARFVLLASVRLLKVVLDRVLATLGSDFQFCKIGFYSCNFSRKLIIMVEKSQQPLEETVQESPTELLKNEYHYFEKYPMRNPVHRFELRLVQFIDGVLDAGFYLPLNPGQVVDLRFDLKHLGPTDPRDYFNFLHEAYKIDGQVFDFTYNGTWVFV